jgi:hypothetical protein
VLLGRRKQYNIQMPFAIMSFLSFPVWAWYEVYCPDEVLKNMSFGMVVLITVILCILFVWSDFYIFKCAAELINM